MIDVAAKVALAPVLYAQARRLRRSVPELPEPPGPRGGVIDVSGDGNARALRLLVAGDSSAAGVGAPTQQQAVAVQLATLLAERQRRPVRWQLFAKTGLTSHGIEGLLHASDVARADVAVLICGVNDVTRDVPVAERLRARERIVRWLVAERGVRHVVFPAMPDMAQFPALPQPIAWYLGRQAHRNNRAQARWAEQVDWVTHVPMDGVVRPEMFCEDGFHPAPALYRAVAERLSAHITQHVLPALAARDSRAPQLNSPQEEHA